VETHPQIFTESGALKWGPSTFLLTDHNVSPIYSNGYVTSKLGDNFSCRTLVIWQPRNTRWWRDTETTLRIHIVRDIPVQNRNTWLLKSRNVWFDIPGIVDTHVVPDPVLEGLLMDNPTNWYPVIQIGHVKLCGGGVSTRNGSRLLFNLQHLSLNWICTRIHWGLDSC